MAKLSRDNLYPGVNAHLQNLLPMRDSDSPSMWTSFHAPFINNITEALNEELPDNYRAVTEPSLQIRSWDVGDLEPKARYPRPDAGIYQQTGYAMTQPTPMTTASDPFFKIALQDLATDQIFPSVLIYYTEDHEFHGRPICRIELLSPSNKPNGSVYSAYLEQRGIALRSHTHLVEIDFFHETPTPVLSIIDAPSYPAPNTKPYIFTVNRVTQQIDVELYGSEVDEPLPCALPIPLLENVFLVFDFNPVYARTFRAGRWGDAVDYEQPIAEKYLLTYREEDRHKLENLRQSILTEHF